MAAERDRIAQVCSPARATPTARDEESSLPAALQRKAKGEKNDERKRPYRTQPVMSDP